MQGYSGLFMAELSLLTPSQVSYAAQFMGWMLAQVCGCALWLCTVGRPS